jgi:hypothetical protein
MHQELQLVLQEFKVVAQELAVVEVVLELDQAKMVDLLLESAVVAVAPQDENLQLELLQVQLVAMEDWVCLVAEAAVADLLSHLTM